jgi:hypothetical protein
VHGCALPFDRIGGLFDSCSPHFHVPLIRRLGLVFAGVSFLIGLCMFGLARSAIHEIAGLVCLVIAAIFFSGAAIVDALRTLRKELREWGSVRQ